MSKLFLVLFAVLTVGSLPAFSQGISPLVQVVHANKKGEAAGSFMVLNSGLHPLVTTLSVKPIGFSDAGMEAVATNGGKLTVNASSIQTPPKSQSSIEFKASCPTSCAFLILTADSTQEKKTAEGLHVRMVLAETIYVEMQPIRKEEMKLTWTSPTTLLLENTGDGFDRPEIDVRTAGKTTPLPYFPIMPRGKHTIEVPPASSVDLRFEKFSLKSQP